MDHRTTNSILDFAHLAKPALVEGKSFCSTLQIPDTSDCRFVGCDFDGCDISGLMFSDCVFEDCSFRRFQMHLVRFWSCKFQKCTFSDGMWINVGFRESTTFEVCTFHDVELEDCVLIGCKFADVAWNGGSLQHTYFDYCTLEAIAFTEAVVRGISTTARSAQELSITSWILTMRVASPSPPARKLPPSPSEYSLT